MLREQTTRSNCSHSNPLIPEGLDSSRLPQKTECDIEGLLFFPPFLKKEIEVVTHF